MRSSQDIGGPIQRDENSRAQGLEPIRRPSGQHSHGELAKVHREIHGCIACEKCGKNRDKHCAVKNDAANEYIDKMLGADGIILGSPVYFQDVTPEMIALIDRTGYVSRANGRMFKNKIGASLVALRRAGGISSLDTMNHFFLGGQMILVGRGIAFGREIGEVEKDTEGIELVKLLGQRMAWLLKKVNG